MKWLLEGYFCVCPRNNSLENIRIYERDFELSQIYFQKGVSFCFQNVRIDRESFLTAWKEVIEIKEKIPVMTYSQYHRARKLVHQCCNYESGNCLAFDDGEFPTPCCAGGSVLLSCLWMNRWRLLYFIKRSKSGVLSAASHSFPVPTGRNTARSVPPSFTAGRKQPVTGKGGLPADN